MDMYDPVSTVTRTDDLPLSASTTIRDLRSIDSADESTKVEVPEIEEPTEIISNLSPTIPAPSPLPEDSPHKYGLRDQVDTPEVPEIPDTIDLPKARRKSSGLEIFNVCSPIVSPEDHHLTTSQEAKTLQSAASFLNGLSTSRRRAESAADDSHPDPSPWTRASLSRPPSRPPTAYHDDASRRKGHNFKPSGFAITRPLTFTQLKCYRGHSRLLMSRNRNAPVECAVCHIDDSEDHYSCSWCALRMCTFCRADFAARGLGALWERIKVAELGVRTDSVHSCSSDSLDVMVKMGG
jgi:hypothetical protein